MATLILSTAGTALGGPVGGAIGSLIGQSIDQQILGDGPRRGPRLGDLSVQTSSYGTAVPRIYGRMRVAGTVVWSTELQEGSAYTGGKGQPESIVYSYTVSLAVALSSRPAVRVRRIWADGKLIRGEAGDLKVKTGFRFYPGSEDQALDPLIASLQGPATTPAYRGLALAVFEDLELAPFGNRIPFLTFEVEADVAEPTVGTVLGDATMGLIAAADQRTCAGYAAYGATRRLAIEPILNCFAIDLADAGDRLEVAQGRVAGDVSAAQLGCSASSKQLSLVDRSVAAPEESACAITIDYYDPSRDYQAGQARASDGSSGRTEARIDAPVVLEAGSAKSMAHDLLSRSWMKREKLTVRLAPAWLRLRPGETITVPGAPGLWQVSRCSIEALTVVAELRATSALSPMLAADAGQALNSPDEIIPPTQAVLFDLPTDALSDQPQILLAASSPGSNWKPVGFEIEAASNRFPMISAPRRSILGTAVNALAPGEPFLLDLAGSVEVELLAADAWLTSCDDEALAAGVNYAALGDEVIQFGSAEALGEGRFRLSRLLRACRGTEWASGAHVAGEPFVMLSPGTLRVVDLPPVAIGSEVSALPTGVADGDASPVRLMFTGEGLRPPSPVHFSVAKDTAGGLELSWVRRSRNGWAWLDGIEVPLGEKRELYHVSIAGSSSTLELEGTAAHLTIPAAALAPLGSGAALVQVRQIGSHASSRPATAEIILT